METPKPDNMNEPSLLSEAMEDISAEVEERDDASSVHSNEESGKFKRKRADEDEEDDDNLRDSPDSSVETPSVPTKEIDNFSEEKTAERSDDDGLDFSSVSDKGIAKKSTAKGSKPGPLSKKPKHLQDEQADAEADCIESVNEPGTSNSSNVNSKADGVFPFVSIPAENIIDATADTELSGRDVFASAEDESPEVSNSLDSARIKKKVRMEDDSRTPLITNGVDKSTSKIIRGSRKGKSKLTYKHAQPILKKRTDRRSRNVVSDYNSSDEDDDGDNSKVLGSELASLFYKKFGKSKVQENKSLMDRLHRSIFPEQSSESESEEEYETAVDQSVVKGKTPYKVINCPGAGKYEAFVGPLGNSKLSIIRCQEFTQVKNYWYEVYKVRVTSSGREANTNILIPVPEGYKVYVPSKSGQEVPAPFSHTAHEDCTAKNRIGPKFLEKLAITELKLRKYKDEVKVLRNRYVELLKEYANRPQFSTISDLVGASSKFLTEDQLVFFLMQLKSGAHNMQGIRYSVREKVLALSIYQKSPEVYKWLRKLLNLPSKSILERWLEDIGCQDPQLLKKLMYHVYANYNFKRNIF